jgi:hypothetical protein
MNLNEFLSKQANAKVIHDAVAYIAPLTFGRWRLNITTTDQLYDVGDFY